MRIRGYHAAKKRRLQSRSIFSVRNVFALFPEEVLGGLTAPSTVPVASASICPLDEKSISAAEETRPVAFWIFAFSA